MTNDRSGAGMARPTPIHGAKGANGRSLKIKFSLKTRNKQNSWEELSPSFAKNETKKCPGRTRVLGKQRQQLKLTAPWRRGLRGDPDGCGISEQGTYLV